MSFVVARTGGETVVVRSDFLVSQHPSDEGAITYWPLPKLLILDEKVVVGVAGDDPQGAIGNLLSLWDTCDDASSLRDAIEADGDNRREFLMATADGELFKWKASEWKESQHGQEWIGSRPALEAHQPDPFDWELSKQDRTTQEECARWARDHGFSEEEIRAVVSGRVARDLGPSFQFDNALSAGIPDVGGFVAEVHLVEGRFRFSQLAEAVVIGGGQRITTKEEAMRCLITGTALVSHRMFQAGETYPAALRVDFTTTSAAVVFTPGSDGYETTWIPPRRS